MVVVVGYVMSGSEGTSGGHGASMVAMVKLDVCALAESRESRE